MTLYYFLKERARVDDAITRFSPLAPAETSALVKRLKQTINSVVKGSLFIALIQGALTAVGFLIFGIPNAVLWGSVAVIGALIPSVGTALVMVPGIIYLLLTSHTGAAIGLAIYGFIGVGTVDNFLRPYLVGGQASIHPLLVLLSVLGGIAFFGAGGLFLGPLVVSLLLGLLSIYTPSRAN
jgi:predicted PurR-regulated permease PerM